MYLLLLLLIMLLSYSFGRRFSNDAWIEAADKGHHRFCRKAHYEVKEVGK